MVTKTKAGRKKARRLPPSTQPVRDAALLDFIARQYDDLENLKDVLEFLPGCSISEIETECWEALGMVKNLMSNIESLGEE